MTTQPFLTDVTPSTPVDPAALHAEASELPRAFESVQPEMKALDADELLQVNLDVPQMCTTVLGVLPGLRALRGQMVEELPKHGVASLDRLAVYVQAVAFAHARYTHAGAAEAELPALNDRALSMRSILQSDLSALATRGLIPASRLVDFKGLTGYRNVAFDLIGMASLMQEVWTTISAKTAVTSAELDEAMSLGVRMMNAVGARENTPAIVAAAGDDRQRAFTLLSRAYDDVRQAISFLRWKQNDADTLAPSLYAGRARAKATPDAPATVTTPPVAATPTPVSVVTGASGTNATTPMMAPVPKGHPGGSPFAS